MPESWKAIPINAGLLAAIASGVAATVLTMHGVQLWVDARVGAALDYRVAPIERRQERLAQMIQNQQRDQIERDQQILELLRELREQQGMTRNAI